jgi:hypothetical protein
MRRATVYDLYHPTDVVAFKKMENDRRMAEDSGSVSPSVIFHSDDLLEYILPTNPAFNVWGTRDADGTPLPDGSVLSMPLPSGDEAVFAMDASVANGTPFEGMWSIERNRETIQALKFCARESDGVVVSSKEIKDYFENEVGCGNVFVLPNTMRLTDIPQVELAPPDKTRILWQGGASHTIDMVPILPSIRRVIEANDVEMVFWGDDGFGRFLSDTPKDKVRYEEWGDFELYFLRLATMNHDINLCPLVDNRFNRAKTAIKFYEASLLWKPAATLAANVGPYGAEIVDGETGLLYNTPEEFEAKLTLLIKQVELRKKLAAGAKRWVTTERNSLTSMTGYASWLKDLVEARKPRLVKLA